MKHSSSLLLTAVIVLFTCTTLTSQHITATLGLGSFSYHHESENQPIESTNPLGFSFDWKADVGNYGSATPYFALREYVKDVVVNYPEKALFLSIHEQGLVALNMDTLLSELTVEVDFEDVDENGEWVIKTDTIVPKISEEEVIELHLVFDMCYDVDKEVFSIAGKAIRAIFFDSYTALPRSSVYIPFQKLNAYTLPANLHPIINPLLSKTVFDRRTIEQSEYIFQLTLPLQPEGQEVEYLDMQEPLVEVVKSWGLSTFNHAYLSKQNMPLMNKNNDLVSLDSARTVEEFVMEIDEFTGEIREKVVFEKVAFENLGLGFPFKLALDPKSPSIMFEHANQPLVLIPESQYSESAWKEGMFSTYRPGER